jgi:hypothetical protein
MQRQIHVWFNNQKTDILYEEEGESFDRKTAFDKALNLPVIRRLSLNYDNQIQPYRPNMVITDPDSRHVEKVFLYTTPKAKVGGGSMRPRAEVD